jgi:hypothetical protein
MPFWVVYGRDPPTIRAYSPGEVRLPAVDGQLRKQDEFLTEIRDHLDQVQLLYRTFYDRKQQLLEFSIGD